MGLGALWVFGSFLFRGLMKVLEYLNQKYVSTEVGAITKAEAKAFGIPHPLRSGWTDALSNIEITPEKAMTALRLLQHKQPTSELKRFYMDRARALLKGIVGGLVDIPEIPAAPIPKRKRARTFRKRDGFYQTKDWRMLRYQALQIHGGACQCCGATAASGVKIHVDHIKPRSKFPELQLTLSNLQVLCELCNLGKSNVDATDWRPAEFAA